MNVAQIPNWIGGKQCSPSASRWIEKYNPHSGELLCLVADSCANDCQAAVSAAAAAFPAWAATPPVRRGQTLSALAALMRERARELAECIAVETGKPLADAEGEVSGAILQAEFFAGEGMRLYARSLTSAIPGKSSHTVRQPHGVAALIVPANTPIANIAWKVFPALVCGNTVVLKASEDAPRIAYMFAQLTQEAKLQDGAFNMVQGQAEAGTALVDNPQVSVISFTGSTAVGKKIAETAGRRLARVSLELGGKNAFVVCDDADMEKALHWASLSAFSNAGQRCAAGSRLIIFNSVYEEFRDKLVRKANALRLGIAHGCDLGPVVSAKQHKRVLEAIERAAEAGGRVLCGGGLPALAELEGGYYVRPTLIEGLAPEASLSQEEIFGPVAALYRVGNLEEALWLANATEYGLTAAIHTGSVDRAMWFTQRVKAGVANVNMGTYGSEPHMPFGGFGLSGNGTREPGVEALDVYSELKNISFLTRDDRI